MPWLRMFPFFLAFPRPCRVSPSPGGRGLLLLLSPSASSLLSVLLLWATHEAVSLPDVDLDLLLDGPLELSRLVCCHETLGEPHAV